MGDRANIEIVYDDNNKIYFYTHWSGTELPQTLQSALVRGKNRWDDDAYLARIIFSEMIRNEVLDETGYGIAPYILDTNHILISVDCPSSTVTIGDGRWGFEEFINVDIDGYNIKS